MDKRSQRLLLYTGLGALVGAGLTKLYQKAKRRREKAKLIQKQTSSKDTTSDSYKKLVEKQLACNIQFFGKEGNQKICDAFVIVVGIGGVGSHVLSALVRAGVRKIRIIDFDRINLSSLNRHAFATRENVGIAKVDCCIKYVKAIFPHIEFETIEEFLSSKNLERLLGGNPTYVVDCIDNIDAKTDLVAYCVQKNIKIISACGAGMKADPTRIQVQDIKDTTYDDLSRALRRKLKLKGIIEGVPVVYSTERTTRELLPLKEHQEDDPDNFRLLPGYRVRIIPVFSAMPALVGYAVASYLLTDIAGQLYQPHEDDEVKSNNYCKLYQVLQHREKKLGVKEGEWNFDLEDVYLLARHIFQWRCFLTGNKNNLELVRWNLSKPASANNLVLFHANEVKKHLEGEKYSEEIEKKIAEKFALLEEIKLKKEPVYSH